MTASPNTPNPGTPPAGDPATPPQGTQPNGQAPVNDEKRTGKKDKSSKKGADNKTQKSIESFDPAAQKLIKRLREENAKLRVQDKDVKKAGKTAGKRLDAVTQELSETQAKQSEYILRTQERLMRAEMRSQATKMGIIDPDVAIKLLDRASIQTDEDGVPTNAEQLLSELVKKHPYLVGKSGRGTGGGATNPTSGGAPTNFSMDWYRNLTPADYDRLPKETQQALINWLSRQRR